MSSTEVETPRRYSTQQPEKKYNIPEYRFRRRDVELARPKECKSIWITGVGPRLTWGTQETVWPLPSSALEAKPSARLITLAQPKTNFQRGEHENRPEFVFSCGRPSEIWEVSPGALNAQATERLAQLAQAKRPPQAFQEDRPHFVFSCGRSSPIWEVKRGVVCCRASPRVETLAQAKAVHPTYQPCRGVETIIPVAALRASSSTRLESLALPKDRPEGPFRDPIWMVSESAKKTLPTNRCSELAKSKGTPDGYLPPRDEIWQVPQAAQRTSASTRLEELSRPIIRASMDHVQFSPDAFVVKENAKKARCSQRVQELAAPIHR